MPFTRVMRVLIVAVTRRVVASRRMLPFTCRPRAEACPAGADPVGRAFVETGHDMPLAPRRTIVCSMLIAVLAMLHLQACSRQETEWRRVRAEDSPAAYEDYLRRNPGAAHREEAQERLRALREEREWERALRLDAPEAFQQYLGAYPEGRYAAEARERLADFLLAQAPSGVPEEHRVEVRTEPPRRNAGAVTAALPQPSRRPPVDAGPPKRTAAADVRAVAAAPPASRKPVAGVRPPAAKGQGLQLGAFAAGEGAARGAWENLQRAHRDLIGGLTPSIDTVTRDGRTLWRLRAGPVDARRAAELCAALRARGAACVVAAP